MAFSGDYAEATVSNPSAALTDFSLLVDLSTMPASWWSAVDTSDGTKGRASKGDGTTELAADWINFDDTGETGWVRVKWSGTLAASGTQKVRMYPPKAANSSYAANDTYGSDNAYDSYMEAYWPLDGDANDRTSNNIDLSASGTPSGATGKVGGAYNYDGSSDYHSNTATSPVTTLPFMFSLWFKTDLATYPVTDECIFFYGDNSDGADYIELSMDSDDTLLLWSRDCFLAVNTAADLYDQAWHHAVGVVRDNGGQPEIQLWVDNSSVGTDTNVDPSLIANFDAISIARREDSTPGQYFDGTVDEVMIRSEDPSSAWITEEYSQGDDQSAFWGSWTWVSAGGSSIVPLVAAYFRRHRG